MDLSSDLTGGELTIFLVPRFFPSTLRDARCGSASPELMDVLNAELQRLQDEMTARMQEQQEEFFKKCVPRVDSSCTMFTFERRFSCQAGGN